MKYQIKLTDAQFAQCSHMVNAAWAPETSVENVLQVIIDRELAKQFLERTPEEEPKALIGPTSDYALRRYLGGE